MQDKYLFEYAVIRIVPRVERGEFINAGVILYCRDQKFLNAIITFNEERLCHFSGANELDIAEIKKYLNSFVRICRGDQHAGPIGELPPAERFRWLTAARSTVVQTSPTHPGFCTDAGETLIKLHQELVG